MIFPLYNCPGETTILKSIAVPPDSGFTFNIHLKF